MEGTQWRVDSNHNSIMAVGNGGAKPVTAGITLFYDQGTKQYRMEKRIEPDSQVWVNFADLIQNRIPDKDGNVLPEDTKSGTYSIQVISHPLQAVLYEGKVITDKTYGHATYGCIICCGYDSTGFDPLTAYTGLDATTGVSAMGTNTCTNISQSIDDFFPTWWPSNASIFTMAVGSMTGVSVGTGNTNASTTTLPVGGEGIDRPPHCPQRPAVDQGMGNVQCPSSDALNDLTALSITLLFPGLETGIGAVATIEVLPDTGDWNGSQIQETLTTASNSCPASWGNLCQGSSTFTVGDGGQAQVLVNGKETPVGPVFEDEDNVFYDQHTLVSNVSLLDSSGINSCTAVCTQTYSCGITPVGTHTITYSFIKAQINGTHVTSTEVSEQ